MASRSSTTSDRPRDVIDDVSRGAVRVRVVIYALYACMIAAALFADLATRPIWLDEAFSYFQVRDRDLPGLVHSFDAGVNALPYGYFLILWAVDHLVGLGPVALRAPSAVFGFAAVVLLHNLIRRHFGEALAFAACVAGLMLSEDFILYTHEARPYSLYLLLAVLSLYAASALAGPEKPRKVAFASNTAISFLLPSVHYVGLPYSVATAVALLLLARGRERAFRLRIAASFLAGWALFAAFHVNQVLLFLTGSSAIRADWIQRSGTWDVFGALKDAAALLPPPLPIVLLAFALIALLGRRSRAMEAPGAGLGQHTGVIVFASVLWVPMAAALHALSAAGLPTATLPRYFAPSLAATAVVSAFILHAVSRALQVTRPDLRESPTGATAVGICALFLVYPLVSDLRTILRAPHAVSQRALERDFAYIARSDVPSVTNNIHVFFPYSYYSTVRNLSLLRETRREAAGIKMLDGALSVMLTADLEHLNRFQFVHMPGSANSYPGFELRTWAQAYGYVVTETGSYGDIRVFDVRRKTAQ